jgi:ADP-ribose pyrophosphatase
VSQHPRSIPVHAKKVFTGVIYDIWQWQQELFDGSYTTFEMASRADVVSIIPVIGDEIIVLHEEQPMHDPRIGFPGGHMDPGELPLQSAIRELHEETGMVFKNLKLVMVENIGGGKLDWWGYRYVATELIRTDEPHIDPGEKIRKEQVSFAVAKELARNNPFMSHGVIDAVGSLEELVALPAVNPEE